MIDESGDPLPGANVQVMRYQYAQGNRQLVPAGTAQTDDQGAYRVWGLNPGDYYVSASSRTFNFGGRGGPGRGGPGLADPAGGGLQVRTADPVAVDRRRTRIGGGAGAGRGGRGAPTPDTSLALQRLRRRLLRSSARRWQRFGADTDPVAYAPTFYPGVAVG